MYRCIETIETISFENVEIEREIKFENGKPVASSIKRKKSGYIWRSGTQVKEPLKLPGFDWEHCRSSYDEESGTILLESNYSVKWKMSFIKETPSIRSQLFVKGLPTCLPETIENLYHDGKHLHLRCVSFYDQTDGCDSLVAEKEISLYGGGNTNYFHEGNLFIVNDPSVKESAVICKESPVGQSQLSFLGTDVYARTDIISVRGCGAKPEDCSEDDFIPLYPVTIMLCPEGEEEHTARMNYSVECGGRSPYIMSNTWGDRSQDRAVCESFIKEEILCAKRLGVDVVQIDDGWQTGKTSNSAIEENGIWVRGFYDVNPDFWKPDPVKFPSGLGVLCDFARENGVRLGLWFSPDGKNDYENWQKDADTLYNFYRNNGICHFKIDGICISSKKAEINMQKLCYFLMEKSSGEISFNMDITADQRFGYFFGKTFGNLFVENRYTDYGSYFPHNTLRNLWQLSHYIPAQKLQMEILNINRNQNVYRLSDGTPDPLAPIGYDMDFIFASVLVSSPLIWMEMQYLPEADAEKLSKIIAVYKMIRDDFIEMIPRGDRPNGFSMTGFEIRGKQNTYYVALREKSLRNKVTLPVKQILLTNDESLKCEGDDLIFSAERKYCLLVLRNEL